MARATTMKNPPGDEQQPEPDEQDLTLPPILDLDTVAPQRTTILIDKKPYELKLLGDYGIEEQHVIDRMQAEFDRLWETDPEQLKEEEKKRLGLLLEKLIVKAVDAPKTVINKLNDEQKKQVVQVFISAPLRNLQKALQETVKEMADQARTGSTSET